MFPLSCLFSRLLITDLIFRDECEVNVVFLYTEAAGGLRTNVQQIVIRASNPRLCHGCDETATSVTGGKNNAQISRGGTRFALFNMGWKPHSALFPSLSTSKVKRYSSLPAYETLNCFI